MNVNPQAMPNMCGTVARKPKDAADDASIALLGPGVMYMAMAKTIMEGSVVSMAFAFP
jgi:hypothetical protein